MMEKPQKEKKEIVEKLLKQGILITPKELEHTTTKNLESFLSHKKPTPKPVVFIQESPPPPKTFTVKDLVAYKNNKYNFIRTLLLKKTNALSINKIKTARTDISIIGMVKTTTPRGLIVEDTTGTVEVILKSHDCVQEDDVVGITGTVREGTLFATKIVFPDIPLNRMLKKHNARLIFTHTTTESLLKEASYALFTRAAPAKTPTTFIITTTPTTIKLFDRSFTILVYVPPHPLTPQEAVSLLRKRHLSPPEHTIQSNKDHFFIADVPDVMWIVSDVSWKKHYKGVCLFSCSTKEYATLDTETREVEFKPLTIPTS